MRNQLELVQYLANLYFEQHDNAWQIVHGLQMQACMEDMTSAEQTEYLIAWLGDRGVRVNLDTGEPTAVVQEAA